MLGLDAAVAGNAATDFFFWSIRTGPSGLAVISLQKVDSLLVYMNIGELKRFFLVMQCRGDFG